MNIVFVEPFFSGSHSSWINGIKKYSRHKFPILSMKGEFWKWRMLGGCINLAEQFNNLGFQPDLIIVSDMLDLPGFLALTRKKSSTIPVVIYFHENQLTYPWPKKEGVAKNSIQKHYVFTNYMSALSADHIYYNSKFHLNEFTGELPNFLNKFPDENGIETISIIKAKSSVLPIGMELTKFKNHKSINSDNKIPIILWNHRWEYDKNPKPFFNALYKLDSEGIEFKLAILGEKRDYIPHHFLKVKEKLSHKIVKFGFAESFEEYSHWLWNSHILPVTSMQEFFGISVMEAIYCQCIPLLPDRLTYPELIPIDKYEKYFYFSEQDFINSLRDMILNFNNNSYPTLENLAEKYDWSQIIDEYDNRFDSHNK